MYCPLQFTLNTNSVSEGGNAEIIEYISAVLFHAMKNTRWMESWSLYILMYSSLVKLGNRNLPAKNRFVSYSLSTCRVSLLYCCRSALDWLPVMCRFAIMGQRREMMSKMPYGDDCSNSNDTKLLPHTDSKS